MADRLAMSRVAISHIEMDLSIPSERSITLMVGLFKLTPIELIQDTTYPRAKAERLPEVTNFYTELEYRLALAGNDVEWIHRLENSVRNRQFLIKVIEKWRIRLDEWDIQVFDERERMVIEEIRRDLECLQGRLNHLEA